MTTCSGQLLGSAQPPAKIGRFLLPLAGLDPLKDPFRETRECVTVPGWSSVTRVNFGTSAINVDERRLAGRFQGLVRQRHLAEVTVAFSRPNSSSGPRFTQPRLELDLRAAPAHGLIPLEHTMRARHGTSATMDEQAVDGRNLQMGRGKSQI